MKFASFAFGLLISIAASLPTLAFAATSTASFGVTATVEAGCKVTATASGIHSRAVANPSSAVSVTCTQSTPYNIGVDAGLPGNTVQASVRLGYAHTVKGYLADTRAASRTGDGAYQPRAVHGQTAGVLDDDADAITVTVTY
jgi:spore coat protein U-like protein